MKLSLPGSIGATLVAVATLTSCAAPSDEASSSSEDEVLTYLEPNWFTTLYPPAAGYYPNGGVVNQITDRLLYQDPDTLELEPWIATSLPEVNADATEFTFDIRTDVTYSDGTPLTARNVVANIDLYGKGDKSRLLSKSEQISNYDYGEVVDDDTVRFHFTAPAPGFAQAVSVYNAGLLSDATLALRNEDYGPGNAVNIIGSGPFVITGESLGTDLTLTTREDYNWAPPSLEHQGRARIGGVHVTLAAEEAMRTGAVISGQADVVRSVTAPAERHLADEGVQVYSRGTNSMNNQLALRFNHPLLQDIRTRQALAHAVNREEILRVLFSDSYPLATSTVATTGLGYAEQDPQAYAFDPDRARALLAEAGWTAGSDGIMEKDGQRLALRVNIAGPQPRSREVQTMIQDQLRAVGIALEINSGDNASQNADAKDQNKIQIYHSMVGRADYDAINSLYSVGTRDVFINQDAEGNVIDQHLEDLLQRVVSTPDDAGRAAATRDVQDYITQQAYSIPLFEEPQVYALSPRVKGFRTESVARPSFYDVYIESEDN
ncbi:Glutathione-binding protein GsiB precursor [Corynebacterium capitovis DSM 44611]|uniref:TIGR04028 family ABC transporter substrate-binding protein n=1 Tax=Corynebacterium capitovis TaxID=131081 RepID=UPI00036BAD10|nr:TIGR04028 family ABC transporter substrate-binding protein [Corynebacterium capitovis]WKD56937.1 Glutathione-binding protein GsiB precursor [Corynebacterium capitovis DSM 44611]